MNRLAAIKTRIMFDLYNLPPHMGRREDILMDSVRNVVAPGATVAEIKQVLSQLEVNSLITAVVDDITETTRYYITAQGKAAWQANQ